MKLEQWPIEEDGILSLLAVTTPYRMVGDQYKDGRSHWFFKAIFQRGKNANGSRVTITFPWALFPLLRCGDQYQAGQRMPGAPLDSMIQRVDQHTPPKDTPPQVFGERKILNLSGFGQPVLERMDHALPPHFKSALLHSPIDEYMFVWRNKKHQIILPVLEMLRAVFLKNDTLAKGILDPIFLHSIAQWRVNDKILEIQFRDSFPLPQKRSERNAVLRVLAYIFSENSFFESFQNIGQNRLLNQNSALQTTMPSVQPEILCFTNSYDNTTFIWHIEQISASKALKIQAIHFTHPKHMRQFIVKSENRQSGKVQPGGPLIVHIANPPVKSGQNPKPIPGLPDSFFDDWRLEVKNVGPRKDPKKRVIPQSEFDQNLQNLSFGTPETGALHRGAYIQIAENTAPVGDERMELEPDWFRDQNDGFNALRDMLKELQSLKPNCTLKWYRGPRIIPARPKPIMRPYVIVQFQLEPLINIWLLEFKQQKSGLASGSKQMPEIEPKQTNSAKSQGISTLIVKGISNELKLDDVTVVIQEILAAGLQGGYHWDNDQLEQLGREKISLQIYLVKHSNNKPIRWAQRILISD